MKAFWVAAASGVVLCSAAMAQTTSSGNASGAHAAGDSLRAQVRSNLQQAGFTDIKVMPDSFLVQAKDKSGNPISMIINPNSVTEVIDMASEGGAAVGGTARGHNGFVSLGQGDDMGSKVIGLTVKGANDATLGTIKDLAYQGNQLQAYILSADGRYVAVAPGALHVNYDSNAKTWHASMNTTEAELKAAPQFNYQSET